MNKLQLLLFCKDTNFIHYNSLNCQLFFVVLIMIIRIRINSLFLLKLSYLTMVSEHEGNPYNNKNSTEPYILLLKQSRSNK